MQSAPSNPIQADERVTETVRRGARQCFGAGSMVALLLVLTVMPGAAAFAAPEAVGQISYLLQDVVRPRPDRDPREPRVVDAHREVRGAVRQLGMVRLVEPVATCEVPPIAGSRPRTHETRCEAFAAMPWSMDTPPPAC